MLSSGISRYVEDGRASLTNLVVNTCETIKPAHSARQALLSVSSDVHRPVEADLVRGRARAHPVGGAAETHLRARGAVHPGLGLLEPRSSVAAADVEHTLSAAGSATAASASGARGGAEHAGGGIRRRRTSVLASNRPASTEAAVAVPAADSVRSTSADNSLIWSVTSAEAVTSVDWASRALVRIRVRSPGADRGEGALDLATRSASTGRRHRTRR